MTNSPRASRRSRSTAKKTAPSPALSSRSAMTANFVSIKGSSNVRRPTLATAVMTRRSGSRPATTTNLRPLPYRRADHPKGVRFQPAAGRRSQGAPIADYPRPSRGGFRCRLRFGTLCAVRRPIRTVRLPLAPARFTGDRNPIAQFIERSLRHPGRSFVRSPGQRARSRLAQTVAGGRLRVARGIADQRPSSGSSRDASPFASSRSWRSRTGPIRSSKPPAGGSRSRLPITGGRPPPIIGAGSRRRTASRSAGRSSASAGLAITPTTRSRNSLRRSKPPSIPRKAPPVSGSTRRRATPLRLAAARHGLCRDCRESDSADPQCDEAAPLAGDADAEPGEIDLQRPNCRPS